MSGKGFMVTALVVLVTMAIVYRVTALRNIVVGA